MKNSITEFNTHPYLFNMAVVFVVFILLMSFNALASYDIQAVWGYYTNELKVAPGINPPATQSTSATFFGGHYGPYSIPGSGIQSTTPSCDKYILENSSFGQPISNCIPYPGFQQDAIDRSKKMLYYEEAVESATSEFSRNVAAFRYKALIYEGTGENWISAQFQDMTDHWGEDEYMRAMEAAQGLNDALKYDPYNQELRWALLDIYYDISVAAVAAAKEKMVDAQKYRLGLPGFLPPPGEFYISKEIEEVSKALPLYDKAMKPYFTLLINPMGVDMTRVDRSAYMNGIPFGYYAFWKEVPKRSPFAPSYRDEEGEFHPVVDDNKDDEPDALFVGFKDITLLFTMQRDKARAAAKVARLLALRGLPGDFDKARRIISEAQQQAYTDGTILNGIFTGSQLMQVDRNSGFIEARASWVQGMNELSGINSFLEGNANPLGLDQDFIALVQTDIPGVGQPLFRDSFNYFANLLIGENGAVPGGPLSTAKDKLDIAQSQYEKVQMNRDRIADEIQAQRNQYEARLEAIVGASYGSGAYETPENNTGGEIYIQLQGIELANLRIHHNRQEIENLQAQVENEIERRGKESKINNLIGQTYVIYGRKQSRLTREIGYINAAQVMANELAKGADSWLTSLGAGTAVHGSNAIFQSASEMCKAGLQAEKERFAALEKSEVQYLNDQIADANSEARVKDLLLNMSTLAIESQEAAVMLRQEMGRLQALYDEKDRLEAMYAEAKDELATRYYADPSHRFIMDRYILESDFAFDKAQLWVFMMARALDYKRNTRFLAPSQSSSIVYSSTSVFALRNAEELIDMAKAMWIYDEEAGVGDRQGTNFVRFSIREDFLGFQRLDENGRVAKYPDPDRGDMVDAIAAFRSYLKNVAPHCAPKEPGKMPFSEVVHLEFSTVNTNRTSTFFSPARWNEKIKWIAVKINSDWNEPQLQVWLEQSGTAFIRNSNPGSIDQNRPDRIIGEMTGYPVRYWWLEPNTSNWLSKDSWGFGIDAVITVHPYAPAESWQKREWHEMPPAVTKWILEIPILDSGGGRLLNLDSVSDIEIWFYNYYHARN